MKRTRLVLLLVFGMLAALLPLSAAPVAADTPVAYDMVGSASSGLTSYTDDPAIPFSSLADGFQKFQRGVSSTIPFSVLDDSTTFTADSLGIIKSGNTDVFFGITDTVNGDTSGALVATWVFDITGATDLGISIDMGAMGDFESSDTFAWKYSIDGGAIQTAFANAVDESTDHTYTLEGGASFTLNDPMLMNGTVLTNDLQTFATALTGTGSALTLTLTASTNGGSEAFAFQNLYILDDFDAPLAIDCGADISTNEGVGAAGVISASDPDDAVTSISLVTDDLGGGLSVGTFSASGVVGATETLPIAVADTVAPGNYNATFEAVSGSGQTSVCDLSITVVSLSLVKIHEIQGPGATSPLDETVVKIEGVVVGDFQGTATDDQFGGFHVQEQDGEADGDPMTSEGVFVYAPGAVDVSLGDVVTVIGTVAEYNGLTEITNVTSVVVGGSDTVSPAAVSLPITAQSDWEKYEGMLVTFTHDLYINEFFNYDRFGEVVLATSRQYQGTQVEEPGPDALALAATNALARVILDDGQADQNPESSRHPAGGEFTLATRFRGGDIIRDLTGVVDYAFGNYKIQPTLNAVFIEDNPRTLAPEVGGTVKVAAFNVLNLFTHFDDGTNDICGPLGTSECRGADTNLRFTSPDFVYESDEYARQRDKIVAGIVGLDADVVGLMEIENDVRDDESVYENQAHDPVIKLVEALNAAESLAGSGYTWDWDVANYYNNYPVRNEIIYRNTVTPYGPPVALQDSAFDGVRPSDSGLGTEPVGRPPVVQTFIYADGEKFTVVANHFKSKGSGCDSGVYDPVTEELLWLDPFSADGQGNCNFTRVKQAEAMMDWLATDPTGSGDPDVLVIGDLNSYAMEDPIDVITGAGYANLLALFDGPGEYTYVFDGQLGNLDHALGSASILGQVTGTAAWHINSDEPDILDYDISFKSDEQDALYEPNAYRASASVTKRIRVAWLTRLSNRT